MQLEAERHKEIQKKKTENTLGLNCVSNNVVLIVVRPVLVSRLCPCTAAVSTYTLLLHVIAT